MLDKIKNPKNIAIITLIASLISIIYSCCSNFSFPIFDDFGYFLIACLKDMFMTSAITISIYLGLILFKRKVNLSLLNKITLIQLGIILLISIIFYNRNIIVYGYYIHNVSIEYSLLVLIIAVNLLLLELNKKINVKVFMIIEYVLLLIFIIPFKFNNYYYFKFRQDFLIVIKEFITYLFYIPFIYYMYLYGKSKNRKELRK